MIYMFLWLFGMQLQIATLIEEGFKIDFQTGFLSASLIGVTLYLKNILSGQKKFYEDLLTQQRDFYEKAIIEDKEERIQYITVIKENTATNKDLHEVMKQIVAGQKELREEIRSLAIKQ